MFTTLLLTAAVIGGGGLVLGALGGGIRAIITHRRRPKNPEPKPHEHEGGEDEDERKPRRERPRDPEPRVEEPEKGKGLDRDQIKNEWLKRNPDERVEKVLREKIAQMKKDGKFSSEVSKEQEDSIVEALMKKWREIKQGILDKLDEGKDPNFENASAEKFADHNEKGIGLMSQKAVIFNTFSVAVDKNLNAPLTDDESKKFQEGIFNNKAYEDELSYRGYLDDKYEIRQITKCGKLSLQGLQTWQSQIEESLKSASADIQENTKKIGEIEELSEKVAGLEGLEERLASLEGLSEKVANLEKGQQGFNDVLKEVQEAQDTLLQLMGEIESRQNQLDGRTTGVTEEKLRNTMRSLSHLRREYNDLEKIVATYGTLFENINSRLSETEKGQNGLEEKVSKLDERVKGLETTLNGLDEKIKTACEEHSKEIEDHITEKMERKIAEKINAKMKKVFGEEFDVSGKDKNKTIAIQIEKIVETKVADQIAKNVGLREEDVDEIIGIIVEHPDKIDRILDNLRVTRVGKAAPKQ